LQACQAACMPNLSSNKICRLFNSGESGCLTNFADSCQSFVYFAFDIVAGRDNLGGF
jgi:hypothetical protein